jgi:tripartite-type tricarboxylate transporter receptor subunit TctC
LAEDATARASFAEQGLDLDFLDAAAFGRRIAQDMAIWEEAVKAARLDSE